MDTYNNWQGNYSTVFFGTFNPLLISFKVYNIIILLFQLLYIGSVFFFFFSLSKIKQFFSPKQSIIFSSVYLITSLSFMYSVSEGLYWYSSVLLYLVPFSLSMILLGLIIRYIINNKKISLVFIIILTVCLAGTNYITGIFLGSLLLVLTIYAFLKKNKLFITALIILLIFIIAFSFNVFAPGNFIRISNFKSISVPTALIMTLPISFDMVCYSLFGTIILPIQVLLTPIYIEIIKKFKVKLFSPVIFSAIILLLFVISFAPCTYSYGSTYQETRVQNIQFFYLLLFIMIIYFNLLGHAIQKKYLNIYKYKYFNEICILSGSALIFIFVSIIGVNNFKTKMIVDDIIYHRSGQYSFCMKQMDEILNDQITKKVHIKNCTSPSSLHYVRLINDHWVIKGMEKYYKKEIVIDD